MLKKKYKFDECIKRFEEKYSEIDSLLEMLFKVYRYNTNYSEVLAKVLAINTFYNTRVAGKEIAKLTSHIISIDNLDEMLNKGELAAYQKVSETPEDIKNAFVFASKYCHFHNPKMYPIFDSKSRMTIYYINKETSFIEAFNQNALLEYSFYKDCLDNLIETCEEDLRMYYDKESGRDYRYKKIDEFLWQYCDDNNVAA